MNGILENDTMFSVKEKPWHGLGTVIEKAPSVAEGIELAGLDWKVSLRPLCTNEELPLSVTTHSAVVKDGTNTILGVVGKDYTPLQNSEAFGWFEPFIENGLATLETAGSLFNGKKVFILANCNGEAEITKNDPVQSYILLSNAHDGSCSVRVGFTPIRVVCNNTLTAAENSDLSKLIRIKHSKSVVENLEMVRSLMDTVNRQFMSTVEQYRELATRDVSASDLKNYVKQVFSSTSLDKIITDYEAREKIEVEDARKKLLARVEEIFELEPARKTWNMYNAVNSYLNHERGKTLESRYNSTWFGANKRIDEKAYKLAVQAY